MIKVINNLEFEDLISKLFESKEIDEKGKVLPVELQNVIGRIEPCHYDFGLIGEYYLIFLWSMRNVPEYFGRQFIHMLPGGCLLLPEKDINYDLVGNIADVRFLK